jgi:hypothetical protein
VSSNSTYVAAKIWPANSKSNPRWARFRSLFAASQSGGAHHPEAAPRLLPVPSPLQDTLFIASALGRSAKSFILMNACQVGVGGEELGQYAGFAGYAIAAGFSGFMGPLWSVNDEVAKRIAVDFYRRCFGTDGTASRPAGDVLADMRNQYLSEPDPQKRQSTWVAYVHYGHPHFTLTHAQ